MKRKMSKCKLKLLINDVAFKKMVSLVATNQQEVGWYGGIEQRAENVFDLYDIFVPPQYVTDASIDSDDVEYMEWRDNNLSDYDFRHIRCFAHSHVNMNVFSSGVDDAKQEETIQAFSNVDCKYFFLIVNKRFEYWCKAVNPSTGIWYDVEIPLMDTFSDWVNEENKKVKTRHYNNIISEEDIEFQCVFGELSDEGDYYG